MKKCYSVISKLHMENNKLFLMNLKLENLDTSPIKNAVRFFMNLWINVKLAHSWNLWRMVENVNTLKQGWQYQIIYKNVE